MSYVKSFKELEVYKPARELAKEIFILNRTFPPEEKYSLTDQISRSSRSIGAQIAKAWGKRKYERHFISRLTDSDAERPETQHWLETALECGYLNTDETDILLKKC